MPPLTVKQLREFLEQPEITDDLIVVLAKDAEGNDFSPVPDDSGPGFHSLGHYAPETTWYGDFCSGEDQGDLPTNALVLWPTN
jgi:hypothetical protein